VVSAYRLIDERSPLKGVLRGEVAWGDDLGGRGLVPDCLGWLRVVKKPLVASYG
jgi:hypothetical protein